MEFTPYVNDLIKMRAALAVRSPLSDEQLKAKIAFAVAKGKEAAHERRLGLIAGAIAILLGTGTITFFLPPLNEDSFLSVLMHSGLVVTLGTFFAAVLAFVACTVRPPENAELRARDELGADMIDAEAMTELAEMAAAYPSIGEPVRHWLAAGGAYPRSGELSAARALYNLEQKHAAYARSVTALSAIPPCQQPG